MKIISEKRDVIPYKNWRKTSKDRKDDMKEANME
jgi:hypothetical protein